MKEIILTGVIIVNLALIAYSAAVVKEQRTRLTGNFVLAFLTMGVLLDISATVCMIIGSTHTALSSHGIFGYTALIGMLIDCIFLWEHRLSSGQSTHVKKSLHVYSRYAYIWWVLAYLTGIIIVSFRHVN
jgi:hypothetical protein